MICQKEAKERDVEDNSNGSFVRKKPKKEMEKIILMDDLSERSQRKRCRR